MATGQPKKYSKVQCNIKAKKVGMPTAKDQVAQANSGWPASKLRLTQKIQLRKLRRTQLSGDKGLACSINNAKSRAKKLILR
jgi:hypothetical protein